MKYIITKSLLVAGIALLTVPVSLFAQKENNDKEKKEKELQHIMITRTGNVNEKTIIEIDGDKVKINGKDAKDDKDVHVNVNTIKGAGVYRMNNMRAPKEFNFNYNDGENMSLFSEDANRAMLGVNTEANDKGAEVQLVNEKSAAEKAGLKKGDIITKIDNRKIESSDDLTEAIHAHKPGDKVTITYLREGKTQTATAELGKWKGIKFNSISIQGISQPFGETMKPMPPMVFNDGNFAFGGRPRLGLSIQDTDDGIGVKVLDVDEESNAEKAGIKKDDIILGIDDSDVKGTEDVIRATRASKEKSSYRFKIKRNGQIQTIEVKIPRKLKTADL